MPDKNNTAKKAGRLTVAAAQKAMPGMFPAAALGKMAASRAFSTEKDPNDPGRMTEEKMESLNAAIDAGGSEIDAVKKAGKKKKKKFVRQPDLHIKGAVGDQE